MQVSQLARNIKTSLLASGFSCLLSHRSLLIPDGAAEHLSEIRAFSILLYWLVSFWMIITFYGSELSIVRGSIMDSSCVQRKVHNNLIAVERFKVKRNFRRGFSRNHSLSPCSPRAITRLPSRQTNFKNTQHVTSC